MYQGSQPIDAVPVLLCLRIVITFSATPHHCYLAGTIVLLVTEARVC